MGSYSFEKCYSVSGLKRHARAEDKDSQFQVRLIWKQTLDLLTSFLPLAVTPVWEKQGGTVAI